MDTQPHTPVHERPPDTLLARRFFRVLAWAVALLMAGLFLSPVRHLLPQDFMQFYFAGRLVVSGQASQLHNRAVYEPLVSEMRAQGETIIPYHYFNRPAYYAYFCAPLALFSYRTGMVLTLLLNAALLAFLVWKLPVWFHISPWARPWIACFFPFLWTLAFDQDTMLLTLLLAFAVRSISQGRETLGGTLLAFASFKPHLIWLAPLALLRGGRRRALTSFLLVASGLAAVSFATVGVAGVQQWFELLQSPTTDVVPEYMGNLRALYLRFGLAAVVPAVLFFAASLYVVSRWGQFRELLAAALLASLVFSPHTYAQDYSQAALAAALIPFAPLRWVVFAPWRYLYHNADALPMLLMALAFMGILAGRLCWTRLANRRRRPSEMLRPYRLAAKA
jgi:hypothetical protein